MNVFSCVQQSWNATQEMQFLRSSVRPDPFAQIKWISLTLSLISTKTILSVQFNQFSQLSHSISSVSSGNWLAQLKLIFSQNHLIKLKVNHVSFTLFMLYAPIWKQYSNSEPILACAKRKKFCYAKSNLRLTNSEPILTCAKLVTITNFEDNYFSSTGSKNSLPIW